MDADTAAAIKVIVADLTRIDTVIERLEERLDNLAYRIERGQTKTETLDNDLYELRRELDRLRRG